MRLRQLGPSLVIDTPAKLNLHLDVLGRRPDGFHDLETVMVSVDLFDTLAIAPAPETIDLTCRADGVGVSLTPPADDRNLVVRAARLLKEISGYSRGATIQLRKRIPMEAGMGGGSSDAAATLVGLNSVWNLGLSLQELHAIAARLGSDVNFFVESAPLAICRGRGEQVEPRPLNGPLWFVAVKPPSGLSTAAVFRELHASEMGGRNLTALLSAVACGNAAAVGRLLWNSLESPSRRLSADVDRALSRLAVQNLPGIAMSGSGSACFGLCRSRRHAMGVASGLRRLLPGCVHVLRSAV
jgi:4-diphosphocytidyl-2-C-methyl-D-erythritol kinase